MSPDAPQPRFRLTTPIVFLGKCIVRPFPLAEVREQKRFISDLWEAIRSRPAGGLPVVVNDDLAIDYDGIARETRLRAASLLVILPAAHPNREQLTLESTITAGEVRELLRRRRRSGQRYVSIYLLLASGFFLLWLWKTLANIEPMGLLATLACMMACLVFVISAFLEAYRNWQYRTGRMGKISEFFLSADTWNPS